MPNFSAKILTGNSNNALLIAPHLFYPLPMGLSDDDPSSFGLHVVIGGCAGLDATPRRLQLKLALLAQLFSQNPYYHQQ
jgi:hypothetical protein